MKKADSSMSLRAWARSRGIPHSTAHKAAQNGRITRRSDGRIDPTDADREWVENTRPRVDGRVPAPPPPPVDLAEVERVCSALPPLSRRDVLRCIRSQTGAPAQEQVRAAVASELAALFNRLAPRLAIIATTEDVRDAILATLDEVSEAADIKAKWQV